MNETLRSHLAYLTDCLRARSSSLVVCASVPSLTLRQDTLLHACFVFTRDIKQAVNARLVLKEPADFTVQ